MPEARTVMPLTSIESRSSSKVRIASTSVRLTNLFSVPSAAANSFRFTTKLEFMVFAFLVTPGPGLRITLITMENLDFGQIQSSTRLFGIGPHITRVLLVTNSRLHGFATGICLQLVAKSREGAAEILSNMVAFTIGARSKLSSTTHPTRTQ